MVILRSIAKLRYLALLLAALAFSPPASRAQQDLSLPHVVAENGRHALIVDGAPYLMLGIQIGNSSAWPAEMPKVWPVVEAIHANTVEMPVYWEQLEPTEGSFDYSVVDTLIAQGRLHKVHLVLLWFGTWKNGSSHYEPIWMKEHPELYPRMTGAYGEVVDSPSPFAPHTLAADIAAFSALMHHLKIYDTAHTVLMVQVENETGTWGSVRDYSATAQKLFDAPAPAAVIKAMHPEGYHSGDTWQQAFGPEAEIYFHGWYVASYVGKVAAAGKEIYPLPMYVNAALRDPISPGPPGTYESGGPTDDLIPIWKAAAPAIDILAPDIYISDYDRYTKVLSLYGRPDNALFVPETTSSPANAPFLFAALGHGAIGYSPFGVDLTGSGAGNPGATTPSLPDATLSDIAVIAPIQKLTASAADKNRLLAIARNYALLSPMSGELAALNFEGKLKAVAESKDTPVQHLAFGKWTADITFGGQHFGYGNNNPPPGNPTPVGRALVAQLGPDQFLVTGFFTRIDFAPADSSKHREFMTVQEGIYKEGKFVPLRIWNGDQTDRGLNFEGVPAVLRVELGTY